MNSNTLILIVDDNQTNVQVLGNLLAGEGFKLAVANSGKGALNYLNRKRPNLILLDITMPVMDGFEVCQIIKANPLISDIPIIFISALDSPAEKVKAFELGGADYVTKPFEPMELLARVRTHVQISQLNDEVFMQNRELRTQLAFQTCVSEGLETFLDKTLNHDQIMHKICTIVKESFEFDMVSILQYDEIKDKGFLESLSVATSTSKNAINISSDTGNIVDCLKSNETVILKSNDGETDLLLDQLGEMETVIIVPICLVEDNLWGAFLVARETSLFDLPTTVKNLKIIGSNLIRMYFVRKNHEEELFQSRKMQAVGRLAGGIAHDLNNMLQGVIGYGEILCSTSVDSDDVKTYMKEILGNAERSASLIKQLLRFAQKDVNVVQDVNINRLLSDSLNYIKEIVGSDVEVVLNLSEFELVVRADADQIKHIFVNLSENARSALSDDGRINISTKVIDVVDNQYNFFKDLNEGKYVEITFSDNGCGIDSDMQENVFDPFYTSKDVGEAVGMGLATVFSIVKQHKGDIKLYSEKNIGTTFKIYFPVKQILEQKSIEPVKNQSCDKTILVVEDNASINKLACLILGEAGYETLSAFSGKEAIEIFEEKKDEIDLMLIDIVTPDFSGLEVFEQVSKIKPVSVVFCSGYEKHDLESKYDFPIPDSILKKPYTEKQLLSKVREAL